MTSVGFQGGFLNRMAGNGSKKKKCLSCHAGGSPPHSVCHSCQSHVCGPCTDLDTGDDDVKMRQCDSCQENCCGNCRDLCHDVDCQAVHCKACSTMTPCVECTELFCMEVEGGDEIECAVKCNCDKPICNNCSDSCNLCSAVLCDKCVRDCTKCGDVFCKACDNFVVTCEFCDGEFYPIAA